MSDDLEKVERALARQVAPTSREGVMERRQGVVNAVNSNGTVDVTVGGVIVPGVRYKAWYRPRVDDVVLVEVVGTDFVVDGPLGTAGGTGGILGYAEITSGLTGFAGVGDVTGLSVTVTVGTGRRVKVTGYARVTQQATIAVAELQIWEGATQFQLASSTVRAGELTTLQPVRVLSPSAGSHTYRLRLSTTGGTVDLFASAAQVAFIVVEDIGRQ